MFQVTRAFPPAWWNAGMSDQTPPEDPPQPQYPAYPQYAQPTYGQPAYGQPAYGQQQWGYPAYGGAPVPSGARPGVSRASP